MTPVEVEGRIVDALLASTASLLPFSPPYRIAHPGITFEPQTDELYLRAMHFPNTVVNRCANENGSTEFRGVFQLTVVALGSAGQGIVSPTDVAGSVAKAYGFATRIPATGLMPKVSAHPSIAPALIETGKVEVPVSIPYRCFVKM